MLKGLKDKRNQLIGDLEVMMTAVGTEVRSLNEDEVKAFDAKKKEIEDIDATIARVEGARFNEMSKEEKVVETENRSKDEMEKRALDAFFKGEDLDAEMRTMLASNSSNQATMPLTIAEGLLKRLEELVPVLNSSRRFSEKGTLRLLTETTYGEGALTDENKAFTDADAEFANIDLGAYKITAMTRATFELLASSSIDLNAYLTDVIVRRLAKELNRLFLVGTGLKQPQGLINGEQTVEVGADLAYDDFVKMITAMHPDFLAGATFIMNRETFTNVSLLEDKRGHKYVQNGVINGKFTYTIAGVPILVDNFMPTDKPVILVNIAECYVVNMLQDIIVKRLDQVEFTNGVEVFAGYLMADGRVLNQDALKVAVVGAGGAVVKKK